MSRLTPVTPSALPESETFTKTVRRRTFKRTFLTGVLFLLPVYVTFAVMRFFFVAIHHALTPWVLKMLRVGHFDNVLQSVWLNYAAPVASIFLLLLLISFVGIIAGNVFGKQVLGLVEKVLDNIPVVRWIYSTVRQFLDTFSKQGDAFSKVVVVEYPRKGLWTVALLTGDTGGEVAAKIGGDLVSVFVPTTPNPTSGWLLLVPREDIVMLDMAVDDAFKLIISGGVLTPEWTPKKLSKREST